jgi:hypothetical protein
MSSSPKSKRGCRPLPLGEKVQGGDFVWFASQWQSVENFDGEIGKVVEQYSYRHCRPVAAKKKASASVFLAAARLGYGTGGPH